MRIGRLVSHVNLPKYIRAVSTFIETDDYKHAKVKVSLIIYLIFRGRRLAQTFHPPLVKETRVICKRDVML